MKVLGRDKIVETYRFPFSEALSFSILIWTIWGLAESFFWQKALPFFDSTALRVHHLIYISAFFIYVAIAAVVAAIVYSAVKWILFTMELHETAKFRSVTLCLIMGFFFLAAIPYVFQQNLPGSDVSPALWYALIAFVILVALAALVLLYRSATNQEFRLRRTGTTMMSVLVLSALLSFVSFPLFSGDVQEPAGLDLKASTFKLMAMHYIVDQPQQP